jgi:hypothetical protein
LTRYRPPQKTFSGEEYAPLFRRFYNDEKPRYRAFVAVASVAAALRDDLSQRSVHVEEEVERARGFFGQARRLLENDPQKYRRVFLLTFQALADSVLDVSEGKDETDIAQIMFQKISKMAFNSLYKRILMRIDADQRRP